MHQTTSKQASRSHPVANECSVGGAPLEYVNVGETPHGIWCDQFTYVERTTVCANQHRVMQLTKMRNEAR
jgi:hypothetical protein